MNETIEFLMRLVNCLPDEVLLILYGKYGPLKCQCDKWKLYRKIERAMRVMFVVCMVLFLVSSFLGIAGFAGIGDKRFVILIAFICVLWGWFVIAAYVSDKCVKIRASLDLVAKQFGSGFFYRALVKGNQNKLDLSQAHDKVRNGLAILAKKVMISEDHLDTVRLQRTRNVNELECALRNYRAWHSMYDDTLKQSIELSLAFWGDDKEHFEIARDMSDEMAIEEPESGWGDERFDC